MRKRNGYVLIMMAAGSLVLFGMLGLAVDVGRMYITKNELQTFTDSAALSAALRLNGTSAGITRARSEVDTMAGLNAYAFTSQTTAAEQRAVEFGDPQGNSIPNNWSGNPGSAAGYSYARVRATVQVPIYFMTVLTGTTEANVSASSVAGQVPVPAGFEWRSGLFPFTPVAQDLNPPDFGFIPGSLYTLRWPANSNNLDNVCSGDVRRLGNGDYAPYQPIVQAAEMRGSENRGYFGDRSNASIIRQQIQNDAQVEQYSIGDTIILSPGHKQTELAAIQTRIAQDADPTAETFAAYANQGHTRRIITVPITDPMNGNVVVGYGRFFLLPAYRYELGANNPFCAEYIGPGSAEGTDGGGGNTNGNGVTKVRLVL